MGTAAKAHHQEKECSPKQKVKQRRHFSLSLPSGQLNDCALKSGALEAN
jgi:hypothetical protein